MAGQQQIEETYNYMDEMFRTLHGEHGDCSCALYDLDFSKSLDEAQNDKHEYILASLGIKPGDKVLDVGCGWGPMLKTLKDRGALGIGLTLSTKQAQACRRAGFEVHITDWRDVQLQTFGRFNAIVSVGSFEHFCSKEEFLAGKQEAIYRQFFKMCGELLDEGERIYVQTMFWGENAPNPREVSLHAKRGSNEYMVAMLEKFYPGSWLPSGEDQIISSAGPYFKVISRKNGRLDYIETMKQWNRKMKFNVETGIAALKAARYFFIDRNFLHKLESFAFSYNRECFKRKIMDHQRFVFERHY